MSGSLPEQLRAADEQLSEEVAFLARVYTKGHPLLSAMLEARDLLRKSAAALEAAEREREELEHALNVMRKVAEDTPPLASYSERMREAAQAEAWVEWSWMLRAPADAGTRGEEQR